MSITTVSQLINEQTYEWVNLNRVIKYSTNIIDKKG